MTINLTRRRDLLPLGGGAAASAQLVPAAAGAVSPPPQPRAQGAPTRAQAIFKPEFHFGLGGVPLGNEFAFVTDSDAMRTLQASWDAGVRYFDVAPWYGLGLAERRYGMFLHN